jgi:hypothetical protein
VDFENIKIIFLNTDCSGIFEHVEMCGDQLEIMYPVGSYLRIFNTSSGVAGHIYSSAGRLRDGNIWFKTVESIILEISIYLSTDEMTLFESRFKSQLIQTKY